MSYHSMRRPVVSTQTSRALVERFGDVVNPGNLGQLDG